MFPLLYRIVNLSIHTQLKKPENMESSLIFCLSLAEHDSFTFLLLFVETANCQVIHEELL